MSRNYVSWYKLKSAIEKRIAPQFSERDVWWCSLGANIGHEEDGKHDNFERPVLVLRKFSKELFAGVPLTTVKKENPYHFPINVGGSVGYVIVSQQRSLSARRLLRRVGRVGEDEFRTIAQYVAAFILKKSDPAKARSSGANGDLYFNSSTP